MTETPQVINIHSFDGQTVWADRNNELYEVGNFLGGGAAGTVYECEDIFNKEHFALKILNPIGYKIISPALLRRYNVVSKGKNFNDIDVSNSISKENVWWLINGSNKQYISAFFSEKYNSLKELSLTQCIEIWGKDPENIGEDDLQSGNIDILSSPGNPPTFIPAMPPKYEEFVRRRNRIFREIKNMRKINNHPNVIQLFNVLELVQESKCTIFLVMELANGGELFDRIKIDCGTREETAKFFFQQLLSGVKHCHDQGVCHRDLKPENLLLQDSPGNETLLKIADFGFSARFAMSQLEEDGSEERMAWSLDDNMSALRQQQQNAVFSSVGPLSSSLVNTPPLKVLKSVVGSPFYVAPEVMQANGYDGTKADVWSLGIILYAMLAGNLPFGQDLTSCKRFRHFCKWIREKSSQGVTCWSDPNLDFPQWLFSNKFSPATKGLIVSMLHPDPKTRISVNEAMVHPLCRSDQSSSTSIESKSNDVQIQKIDQPLNPPSARMEITVINEDESDMMEDGDENEADEKDMDEDIEMEIFEMEDDFRDNSTPVVNVSAKEKSILDNQNLDANAIDYNNICKRLQFDSNPNNKESELYNCVQERSRSTPPPTPSVPAHLVNSLLCLPNMDDLIAFDEDIPSNPDSPLSNEATSSCVNKNSPTPYDINSTRPFRLTEPQFVKSPRGDKSLNPPSFNDLVKKSTRFITAVPAYEVLDKVEGILRQVKVLKTETPIGFIGKVELNWEYYRLEVWGLDINGPPLCALQLYQMPYSSPSSPDRQNGLFPGTPGQDSSIPYGNSSKLFLAEFIRGQIEIFAFKRFYQWVRQKLSELVKRDYSIKFFDQAASPKVDSYLLQRFHQLS